MAARKTARRVDPHRRQRIIDATLAVIAEHGVAGLTHRRVAAEAKVPLGSTTDHFDSLDDLLTTAMTHAVAVDLEDLELWLSKSSISQLATGMAQMVVRLVTDLRAQSIVNAELITSAYRHPDLREVAEAWDRRWIDLMTARLGAEPGRAVMATGIGLVQSAMLDSREPDVEEIEAVLRYVLQLD